MVQRRSRQKAAEGEFSVILLDRKMPVMDGYTAAEQIRKTQRTEAGKNDFIGKPFYNNDLLRKTAGRILC